MKGKLRSLYTTSSKTAGATADQGGYTTVLNRNMSSTTTTSAPSVGKLIVNQEQVTPQLSKHMATSVSLYLPSPEIAATAGVSSYSATRMDTLYGGGAVDDAVDLKAEDYISSVRKKFSLAY